ncbi:uncharacterized protein [Euwallacea fornicatus]|uniref:uncharacterized protein n=1 Tax=Euwallacea fornicatus TaxID=995702 RepID=UPI00338F37FF
MDVTLNREIFQKHVNESTTNLSLSQIIEDESKQVQTVVIFVISAVLIIILIFVLAVFIDCRQQKINDSNVKSLKKRVRRKIQNSLPKLPTIGERPQRGDERSIVANMEVEPSTSQYYVI